MSDMLQLAVDIDPTKTIKLLRNAQKQVTFANVQACNKTALDVQTFTVSNLLPRKFTLRSKGAPWYRPGTRFGFNINFASKKKVESRIGSRADWLERQEKGGEKKVEGHKLAIPSRFWKAKEEIMSREKKPKTILKDFDSKISKAQRSLRQAERRAARTPFFSFRSREQRSSEVSRKRTKLNQLIQIRTTTGANAPFVAKMPSGNQGIYVRTGKGRGSLKALFTFEADANIKPILGFYAEAGKLVAPTFDKHFATEFRKALLTAK